MFSILLAKSAQGVQMWDYYKESDAVYVAPDIPTVQTLAKTNPVDKIRVVKNCTIAAGVTVTVDGEDPEPNSDQGE
jgi:hypothetical protein